jgi:NTP pyrophosphatase (non-canonical NTP hydrolase)
MPAASQPSAIERLTRLAVRFRDQRDWKQFHNANDMILSLNLEAAELLELVQWKKESELEDHLARRHHDLADELCDVLYWVLTIAHDHGIDLEKAFPAKIRKNQAKYPIHKSRGKAQKYTEL